MKRKFWMGVVIGIVLDAVVAKLVRYFKLQHDIEQAQRMVEESRRQFHREVAKYVGEFDQIIQAIRTKWRGTNEAPNHVLTLLMMLELGKSGLNELERDIFNQMPNFHDASPNTIVKAEEEMEDYCLKTSNRLSQFARLLEEYKVVFEEIQHPLPV